MNELEKERVKRFAQDEATVDAVFSAIQDVYIKTRSSKETQYLAAKSLAIEFLEEAKVEISRLREGRKEEKEVTQIGL
jgi:hypothetical protein